jgi:hypothetical protein
MSKTTSTVIGLLLGVTLLGGVAQADAPTRDPRIGAWIEQPGPGSAGLHTTYEDLGDGRVRIHLSGLVVDARCDGASYPFVDRSGKAAGPTYSCRITRPRSVEYLYTQLGRQPWSTSKGVESVSEDGGTLTHVGVRQDANGVFVEDLCRTFSRQPAR